jgi:hypothetical protein
MTLHPDDITLAARGMTDVEPLSDLEARIQQRLDAVTPATTARRWPWVAGLATAAATVLVAVVMRSPEVPESRGLPAVALAKAGPGVPESRSAEVPQSPGLPAVALAKAGPAISSPIRLPAYRSISESEWAWMSRRVPALDLIDPIQPEPVSITPLTITPLVTSPMFGNPDAGRQ